MSEIKPVHQVGILVVLAVAVLLIFFLSKGMNTSESDFPKKGLEIGNFAPDFTYPDLSGKSVSLSDFRGSVVLVNIWATWCPPCVAEVPSMEALYRKLKGENFEILAISIDQQGQSVVSSFMEKHKLTFPALLDPKGTISLPYRATGVPESFIVDKKGILAKKIIGPIDWESPEVISYIRNLMEQEQPA